MEIRVHYIFFADVSICTGVDIPDGRRCMPDGQGGFEIKCIPSCPKPSLDDAVCAADFGIYPSRCHMQMETCQMYGVDVIVREVNSSICKAVNNLGNSFISDFGRKIGISDEYLDKNCQSFSNCTLIWRFF